MKIQELAIIFIIIILPISLVLSEYTQFQIKTISLQTEYDAKLTAATYDAIKAFQLNTTNSSTSDLANSRLRDLEASINAFRNSLMSGFKLNGYTEEELNNYIPALVYTLYDGFYIYSPYNNIVDDAGNILEDESQHESLYGIKPYINYSCRYIKDNIDVVITYSLDNYITVKGTINGEFVNKGGYLIDGITYNTTTGIVKYNGIEIKTEHLKEKLLGKLCSYVRVNGTKYYLLENYLKDDEGNYCDGIVYILNGELKIQTINPKDVTAWKIFMENNDNAISYYREAYEFTSWLKNIPELSNLTYGDAVDENGEIDSETGEIKKIWQGNATKIFDSNSTENPGNIENELSNFNQHRLAVIRHKIETNLAVAISNYNNYSGVNNVFQMPELKETEWDNITHNISLMSFLQGLHIGGKIYNGYTVVTNSQSNEVVMEDDIYYLGHDTRTGKYNYYKMGETGLENGTVQLCADINGENLGSFGRLNLDFERNMIMDSQNNQVYYYYPLQEYNASYNSVVMQNNVTAYDDIYKYVNEQGNRGLAETFYTALGRERYSSYKTTNEISEFYSVLFVGIPDNRGSNDTYFKQIEYYVNLLREEKGIMVESYMEEFSGRNFSEEQQARITQAIKDKRGQYHLIIINPLYWNIKVDNSAYKEILKETNLFTISNDVLAESSSYNYGLPIIAGSYEAGGSGKTAVSKMTKKEEVSYKSGEEYFGIGVKPVTETQYHFKFKQNFNVDIFYKATYNNVGINGEWDYIGCVNDFVEDSDYKWMHSALAFRRGNGYEADMELFKMLIKYILKTD